MFDLFYDKDLKDLKTILNGRTVIINLIYKLRKDKNFQVFKENLFDNLKNYEKLKHMEKINFKDNSEKIFNLLNLLSSALDVFLKERKKETTSFDLKKHCNIFPDSIGEQLLKQLSLIPILQPLILKIKYEEYITNKPSDYAKEHQKKTI